MSLLSGRVVVAQRGVVGLNPAAAAPVCSSVKCARVCLYALYALFPFYRLRELPLLPAPVPAPLPAKAPVPAPVAPQAVCPLRELVHVRGFVPFGGANSGRYGEAASWRANDGGRQRKTACPLLYRYRLTHTYCSLARLPPTHPFLLGALFLQRLFQVRWRALRAPLAPILRQVRRTAQPAQS